MAYGKHKRACTTYGVAGDPSAMFPGSHLTKGFPAATTVADPSHLDVLLLQLLLLSSAS